MSIEITMRSIDAGDDLKIFANKKAEALLVEFPRVEHIHVIMAREKFNRFIAEVVVQGKSRVHAEATKEGFDIEVLLDAVFDKIHKQLRKLRKKMQDRRHDTSIGEITRLD